MASCQNLPQHCPDIHFDICVLKPNDTIAKFKELLCSLFILLLLQIVNASIQLYDQSTLGAVEISDERTQRVLTAELESA